MVFYSTSKTNYLFKTNKKVFFLKKTVFFNSGVKPKTGSQGTNTIFVICKRCVTGNPVVCGISENYVLKFLIIITIVLSYSYNENIRAQEPSGAVAQLTLVLFITGEIYVSRCISIKLFYTYCHIIIFIILFIL